ncbi:MAG: glycosyltransferase family 39 protein [Verrucomicrobiota bacterium]
MQTSTAVQTSPPQSSLWRQTLFVFLTFCALVFFYQWMEGAYVSEFGSHPDEAAHYVTGLMIRDYLAGGFHGSPMTYAKNYYDHYPKVALGNWPPVFYLVQAPWMILFGPGRTPVLLLMAALTAALATLLFNALRDEFNPLTAATGTLIFVSLPIIQKYGGMVMGEILTGCFMFGAMLLFGRFLDRGRSRDAIGFGICAALAILTKGSGGALALAAPMAVLMTWKLSILKRPALWISALIVVVLAGPWTWMFREQCKSGWEEPGITWNYTRQALVYFPWKLLVALGFLLAALALIGAVHTMINRPRNPGKWASLGALVICVCIFQSIIPASQDARHLLSAIPAAILFAMSGLNCLVRWLERRGFALQTSRFICCASLVVLFFSAGLVPARGIIGFSSLGDHPGLSPFRIAWKGYSGFGSVLDRLLADPANKNAVFLISSDARGEGMFVSEMAMRDAQRPAHIVERASKLLARSAWNGSGYQSQVATPEAVQKVLLESRVQLVVLDPSMPGAHEHNRLLQAAVESRPELFKKIDTETLFREGIPQPVPLAVYRIQRPG